MIYILEIDDEMIQTHNTVDTHFKQLLAVDISISELFCVARYMEFYIPHGVSNFNSAGKCIAEMKTFSRQLP